MRLVPSQLLVSRKLTTPRPQMLEDRVAELRSAVYELQVKCGGQP